MASTYEVTAGKRTVTWVLTRLARLGVGSFVEVTVTGRKSGQPRTVTVNPIEDGNEQYLVSPYGEVSWVHNVRAQPRVTLRRGRQDSEVILVEVTGEKPEVVKRYYERESFARQFMDVPGEASVADFANVGDRFPVFRVDEIG